MSDREVSKSRNVRLCSHDVARSSDLKFLGTRYEAVKDGIGLLTGFRKVEMFRCQICLADIEDVDPQVFPPGEF